MTRPAVDVVVPFRGAQAGLEELRARLSRLERTAQDSVTIVDNTPERGPAVGSDSDEVQVVHAPELATPAYARNRGAALGRAEWLVFFDADVEPAEDLLDRYFDRAPGERTALLAGGVRDESVPAGGKAVARYLYISRGMSQDHTFRLGPKWGFAQTANAACRRVAFAEVGGFRECIRAGEDVDLTYRLRAAGWAVERREEATAVHRSRQTVLGLVAQRASHGSAAAWIDREYPGAAPPRRRPGLVWWAARTSATRLRAAARSRDRDEALWALFEPLEQLTLEFGRSIPNERPLPRRSPWRFLR
jgi:GT2 family glycosyltransferase